MDTCIENNKRIALGWKYMPGIYIPGICRCLVYGGHIPGKFHTYDTIRIPDVVRLSINFMAVCRILRLKFCPAESADFADSICRYTSACTLRFIHLPLLPEALAPSPCLAAAGCSATTGGLGAVTPSAAAGTGTGVGFRESDPAQNAEENSRALWRNNVWWSWAGDARRHRESWGSPCRLRSESGSRRGYRGVGDSVVVVEASWMDIYWNAETALAEASSCLMLLNLRFAHETEGI